MKESDKELLELAAKAAGREVPKKNDPWVGIDSRGIYTDSSEDGTRRVYWNPLENDGDALRLAVEISKRKDGIAILLNSRFDSTAFASVYTDADHLGGQEYMVDDPNVATRRAIVRAAAEIGKAMP